MTLSSRIEALEAACLPKEMTTIQIVTVSVDAHGVEQVLSVESLETPAPADDLLIRFVTTPVGSYPQADDLPKQSYPQADRPAPPPVDKSEKPCAGIELEAGDDAPPPDELPPASRIPTGEFRPPRTPWRFTLNDYAPRRR